MEDSINEIVGIISFFQEIDKICITNKYQVTIFWQSDKEFLEKILTNSIDLLEW